MAAGTFTLFNIAKPKLVDGTLDLNSNTFNVALTTTSQALSATFAGSSGEALYADLTAELSTANGYTAGGQALSGVSLTRSTGTVTFDAADISWTLTGSITFRYGVIYAASVTDDPLLGYFEAEEGTSVTPVAGLLTFQWNASGIFTLA